MDSGNLSDTNLERLEQLTFYEITIASVDQPKLLSRLSQAMVRGGAGLKRRQSLLCRT